MPGLYTVVTRAPGTLITELIYNFDHQAHVDGRSAEEMAGYGVSNSQFGLTEDPLPFGVESLPISLAGEITRLRFVLAQIKTALNDGTIVNWYDPIIGWALPVVGARVARATSQAITTATPTVVTFLGGTANFNSGVWVNSPNPTRFTIGQAGKYYAFCCVNWAATASVGGDRLLRIGVNGTFNSTQSTSNNITPSNIFTQPQIVTGLLNLAAADYVEFQATQDVAATLNVTATGGGIVFLGT